MWPMRSNMLVPLTKLKSIKRYFKCKQVEQGNFDKIKLIVERDTLLTFQDFNEAFKFIMMLERSN